MQIYPTLYKPKSTPKSSGPWNDKRAEILEIGRVPLKRTFLTNLAIRDTSVITSLKMTAAGVVQFLLVDEKGKPQQSDNGAIIFGHGITRALICITFAARGAGSKYDRLRFIVSRRKTLDFRAHSRVFYVPGRD